MVDGLTKRQLKASIQQDSMRRWVLGAVYLICFHQDLCIQENPLTRALLQLDVCISSGQLQSFSEYPQYF